MKNSKKSKDAHCKGFVVLVKNEKTGGEYKGRKFGPSGFFYVDNPEDATPDFRPLQEIIDVLRGNACCFGHREKIFDLNTGQIVWETEKEFEIMEEVRIKNSASLNKVLFFLGRFQHFLTKKQFCKIFGNTILWNKFVSDHNRNLLEFYATLDDALKTALYKYLLTYADPSLTPFKMVEYVVIHQNRPFPTLKHRFNITVRTDIAFLLRNRAPRTISDTATRQVAQSFGITRIQ